jgi:predicted DNA binding CopG/RHH family protein
MLKLDDFEKDILESVESDEWQSKGDLSQRTKELQSYLKNQKKKAISIRISESDLYTTDKIKISV